MVAAVDLDQFTQARTTRSWLVDLRGRCRRGIQSPASVISFLTVSRQPNAVTFPELLAGQRRPEIGVAVTDDRQRPVGGSRVETAVAGLRSVSRHQSRRAVLTKPGDQSANLACRQLQPFRCTPWQLAVRYVLNDLEPVCSRIVIVIRSVAAIAASGAGHGRSAYAARKRTFLCTKSGHFNLATTKFSGDNLPYVKSLLPPDSAIAIVGVCTLMQKQRPRPHGACLSNLLRKPTRSNPRTLSPLEPTSSLRATM